MKTRVAWILVLCSALLLSVSPALANTIDGSIGFGGTFTQNGGTAGDLSTATAFDIGISFITPFSETGDFVGATLDSFIASVPNVAVGGLNTDTLWTVLIGGVQYSLTVDTSSRTLNNADQVNFHGTGTISCTDTALACTGGFADTSGAWTLGFNNNGGSFVWSGTSAATPEPGSLALLGSGFAGLVGLISRKRKYTESH